MSVSSAETFTADANFRLSTAVYVQREGQILILQRAMGEAVGGWYLPGGAVEAGENIEDAARREMVEECGLTPSGALTIVGVTNMHVYGAESLQVVYACDCPDGDVVLSDEHSGARWIDPAEYRARYFSDDVIANVAARSSRFGEIMTGIRANLDRYIAMRAHELLDRQLRTMRLTAEVFVMRGEEMLVLKRGAGIGEGVWYLPGGIVDPGEDPRHAAIRETFEESGLRLDHAELVRVWGYPAQNGVDAFHATYVARAPDGDVTLSSEHTAYRWITPQAYAERYCSESVVAAAPEWSRWLREVRANCASAAKWATTVT